MPARAPIPYPSGDRQLRALGERLRTARLRRSFSAETVCARANISRPTLTKIERGDASVTMGSYLQVLRVLGMEQDLAVVAADDVVGRRLQDAGLPRRQRAPRRKKAHVDAAPAAVGPMNVQSPSTERDRPNSDDDADSSN